MKIPSVGATGAIDDIEGLTVIYRYVPAKQARAWQLEALRIHHTYRDTPDAPELMEAMSSLCEQVVCESVDSIRIGSVLAVDGAAHDLLGRLSDDVRIGLLYRLMEVQRLPAKFRTATEGVGVSPAGAGA